MIPLALALSVSVFGPNVERLGAPEWWEREAETRRCDNVLSALLLPPRHDNPEIDARVRDLRTRNLKRFDPVYQERLVYATDFPRWVRTYLLSGDSRIALTFDVFVPVADDWVKSRLVFEAFEGPIPDEFCGPRMWIVFAFQLDYGEWSEFLMYHWQRAPFPRGAER